MHSKAKHIILTAVCLAFAALAFRYIEAATNTNDIVKASGSSVYYLGIDNKRYVFPNEKIYFSWYNDFSGVKTISDQEMAAYQIGGNVTYKPGVRLIKIQSVPKVYAVTANGTLRWVPDEIAAAAIYGADWRKAVDDLSDSFFVNYTIGSDISSSQRYDRSQEIANAINISIDKQLKATSSGSQNTNLNTPVNNPTPVSSGGGGGGGASPITTSDTTAPVISAFSIPATATSLNVTVSTLTASDNIGVTGYMLTETAVAPAANASGWSSIPQTSYTFSSQGLKTLYAWTKDAAGNVSANLSAVTTITLLSTAKAITAFNFNALSPAVTGSIAENNHAITLTVPYGTGVTNLVPTIATTGASVSPSSGAARNFTSPQTYTVTAEDGSTQSYVVTVTAAAGSGAAALVLYTDIASGPITGGENNKGIYLSVFGKNFGASSDMGVNTKVYIGGAEVDNYRYLGASKVQGALGIQQITVQVGSLGNPTLGAALPIDVKVNGVDSNTNITFIPNPGKIYFASLSGNDTTGVANDINHPYRHVQKAVTNNNGSNGCPAAAGDDTVSAAGIWGIVHPGDFIVMRGGTWSDLIEDGFFMRFQNKSGTAPTGALGSGPISLIGYPTEDAFINMDHNANHLVEGGISSADTARQELGCGAWVTVANIRLESGGREGMIALQAGYVNPAGGHWRVVNNELSAATVDSRAPAKGAGVSGSGTGEFYYGNHIHDVRGGTPDHENHGFYIDGAGSYDIAYNWIKDIPGGNGINIYASSGTNPSNIDFHHNVMNNVGKHGLNIADGATHDLNFYDNLIYNVANYCVRFNTNELSGGGVKIWNNTFYNCGAVRDDFGYNAVIANTWNDISSTLAKLYNNIFVANKSSIDIIGGAAVGALNSNLYFGSADTTSYADDAHAVTSNPLFTSTASGAENLTLQATSPAINAGTSLVSSLIQNTRDISLDTVRPQGGSYDIGAYETP